MNRYTFFGLIRQEIITKKNSLYFVKISNLESLKVPNSYQMIFLSQGYVIRSLISFTLVL